MRWSCLRSRPRRSFGAERSSTLRASTRNTDSLHVVVALAITCWQLDERNGCTCGVWAQALGLLSPFVPHAETGLSVQDERVVSAYVRTLFGVTEEPARNAGARENHGRDPDYGYAFRKLLVSDAYDGGDTCPDERSEELAYSLTASSPPESSTAQHTPAHDLEPPPNVGSKHT